MSVIMSDEIRNHHEAICPRCGYDLRGAVEAWKEQCPMRGTCAECGLSFEWREILKPDYHKPRWCIEFTERHGQYPVAICQTLLISLFPWRFWADMKMTLPLRRRRLAAFVLSLLVMTYLVFAFTMGLAATTLWPFQAPGQHTSTASKWIVAIQTSLLPLSRRPIGQAIPSPATRARFGLSPAARLPGSTPINNFKTLFVFQKDAAAAIIFATVFFLACPLGFITLPQSRRRAMVRWRHIIRIFIYSLGIWALLVALACWAAQNRVNAIVGRSIWLSDHILWFTLGTTTLFLFLWWSFSSSRYLRMQYPWVIGLAVTIMAGLVATIMYFVLDFMA